MWIDMDDELFSIDMGMPYPPFTTLRNWYRPYDYSTDLSDTSILSQQDECPTHSNGKPDFTMRGDSITLRIADLQPRGEGV